MDLSLMYQIVSFKDMANATGKPEADLVPSAWIRKDGELYLCPYPPYPYLNFEEMVKQRRAPGSTWTYYEVDCHGSADTHKKGLEKLNRFIMKLSMATTEDDEKAIKSKANFKLNEVPKFPSQNAAGSTLQKESLTNSSSHSSTSSDDDNDKSQLSASKLTSSRSARRHSRKKVVSLFNSTDSDASFSLLPPPKKKQRNSKGSKSKITVSDSEVETPKKNNPREKDQRRKKDQRREKERLVEEKLRKEEKERRLEEKLREEKKRRLEQKLREEKERRLEEKLREERERRLEEKLWEERERRLERERWAERERQEDEERQEVKERRSKEDNRPANKETLPKGSGSEEQLAKKYCKNTLPKTSTVELMGNESEDIIKRLERMFCIQLGEVKRSFTHELRKIRKVVEMNTSTIEHFVRSQGGEFIGPGRIAEFEEGTQLELPCRDAKAFEDFNEHLKIKDNFEKFMHVLRDLWITPNAKWTIAKSVTVILQRYLSKELAQGYSAKGRSKLKKLDFSTTKFYKALEGAVVSAETDVKVQDLLQALGSTFTNVRDWDGGRFERAKKSTGSGTGGEGMGIENRNVSDRNFDVEV